MKLLLRLFRWLVKAAIFFTLFAFALNNQGNATVQFFFGYSWTAPMVLIVLCAFAGGVTIGIVGMVPRWWHNKKNTTTKNGN
jgi:uncharacterized integral membrane protein